jgi:hypothetical protein
MEVRGAHASKREAWAASRLKPRPSRSESTIKFKIKVNGDGQECPSHTIKIPSRKERARNGEPAEKAFNRKGRKGFAKGAKDRISNLCHV